MTHRRPLAPTPLLVLLLTSLIAVTPADMGGAQAVLASPGQNLLEDAAPAKKGHGVNDIPDPEAYRRLIENERAAQQTGGSLSGGDAAVTGTHRVLVLPVEFTGSQTFGPYDPCLGQAVTIDGPLHNEIPKPPAHDNGTLWVPDFSPDHYRHLLFDTGPNGGIGTVRTDLYGGDGVNLNGLTMTNYYLEQSEGEFLIEGDVEDWVQLPVSIGEYGADACGDDGRDGANGPRWRLTRDAAAALNDREPGFDWYSYDADKDGYVDHLMVVNAGQDFVGSTAENTFSIWPHRGIVDPGNGLGPGGGGGYQVAPPTAGYPDGVWISGYTATGENGGVGVLAHEFGHDLGLPDVYSEDVENATGWWDLMSAGSWLGKLPQTQPASMGIWERWQLGWADPIVVDAGDPALEAVIGQAAETPTGTKEGIVIKLPAQVVAITEPSAGAKMWWSGEGNLMDNGLSRTVDLSGKAAPVTLTFQTYFDIEQDFDYGYVEVSADGGQAWTPLDDAGSLTTDADPNGINLGNGITGSSAWVQAQFDLSPYAGQSIGLRFRYVTDPFVTGDGWYVDELEFSDAGGTFFSDGAEAGPRGWSAEPAAGWVIDDGSREYPHYYLVEWRNYSGFDAGLQYGYNFAETVNDPNSWTAEPLALRAPGMLVWYRDTRYTDPYNIMPNMDDPPSWGPKSLLMLVDSHSWPMKWSNGSNLRSFQQSIDAAFTLRATDPVTVTDPFTHQRVTFPRRPAVDGFHDSLGYYPGYGWTGTSVYYHDMGASATVPATGNYSVGVTNPNGTPATELWGDPTGGQMQFHYGTGDPGAQAYGVHVVILDEAGDGSWGKVRVYTDKDTFLGAVRPDRSVAHPGEVITYTVELKDSGGTVLETGEPLSYAANFTVFIPEGTTYVQGSVSGAGAVYDPGSDAITWSGTIGGTGLRPDVAVPFEVLVNAGTNGDTLSAQASVTIGTGNHQPSQTSYNLSVSTTVWSSGDTDCDGDVDSVDALKTLRFVAEMPVSQTEPCPDVGAGEPPFGDVDCDGEIDLVDALRISRSVAGLANILPPGCPPVGSVQTPAPGSGGEIGYCWMAPVAYEAKFPGTLYAQYGDVDCHVPDDSPGYVCSFYDDGTAFCSTPGLDYDEFDCYTIVDGDLGCDGAFFGANYDCSYQTLSVECTTLDPASPDYSCGISHGTITAWYDAFIWCTTGHPSFPDFQCTQTAAVFECSSVVPFQPAWWSKARAPTRHGDPARGDGGDDGLPL